MSKISIVTPLHNKGPYIAETIQSVLAQSLNDWEWVVVENHSTDDGPKQVSDVDDKRVTLVNAPATVRGPGAARNIGVAEATGDYILFLDADDLISPEHLEELLLVAQRKSVDIAASGWQEFRDGNVPDVTLKEPLGRGKDGLVLTDNAIAFAPWAIHCALARRTSITEKLLWDVSLDSYASEDTAFWFRLLNYCSTGYTDGYTALYRTHTCNYRNQVESLQNWFSSTKAVVTSNVQFVKAAGTQLTPSQCENLCRLWSELYCRARKAGDAALTSSALQDANYWLKNCIQNGGARGTSMRLRRLLSISVFESIRNKLIDIRG